MGITHATAATGTDSGDGKISKNAWNAEHVISGLSPAFIGCKVTNTAGTSISSSTHTAIPYATEDFDTDGFHDNVTNNTRITIPAGMGGKYLVQANILLSASFTSGDCFMYIRKNGATPPDGYTSFVRSQPGSTGSVGAQVVTTLDLTAGDYVEACLYQASGTAKTLDTTVGINWFSVVKLDSGKVGAGIGAKAYHSTTQSINSGSWTSLNLDSEEFDTDGFHSTSANTSRMTVATGLGGKYLVTGQAGFATNTTGGRYLRVYKNGNTEVRAVSNQVKSDGSATTMQQVTTILDLAAGDYIELQGFQDSGGALNVGTATTYYQTAFSIMRLDSGSSAYTGPQYGGGTAFPSGPTTGQRFWRSDLGIDCYYDGTRWLSSQLFSLSFPHSSAAGPLPTLSNINVTANAGRLAIPYSGVYSLYLDSMDWLVNPALAHSATNYYTCKLNYGDAADSDTQVGSTLDSKTATSAGNNYNFRMSIGTVLSTNARTLKYRVDKVSSASDLNVNQAIVHYRLVIT